MAFWKNRFGPPDISQLKAEQDVGALINALTYKRDAEIRRDAALTLGELRVRMAPSRRYWYLKLPRLSVSRGSVFALLSTLLRQLVGGR